MNPLLSIPPAVLAMAIVQAMRKAFEQPVEDQQRLLEMEVLSGYIN